MSNFWKICKFSCCEQEVKFCYICGYEKKDYSEYDNSCWRNWFDRRYKQFLLIIVIPLLSYILLDIFGMIFTVVTKIDDLTCRGIHLCCLYDFKALVFGCPFLGLIPVCIIALSGIILYFIIWLISICVIDNFKSAQYNYEIIK